MAGFSLLTLSLSKFLLRPFLYMQDILIIICFNAYLLLFTSFQPKFSNSLHSKITWVHALAVLNTHTHTRDIRKQPVVESSALFSLPQPALVAGRRGCLNGLVGTCKKLSFAPSGYSSAWKKGNAGMNRDSYFPISYYLSADFSSQGCQYAPLSPTGTWLWLDPGAFWSPQRPHASVCSLCKLQNEARSCLKDFRFSVKNASCLSTAASVMPLDWTGAELWLD